MSKMINIEISEQDALQILANIKRKVRNDEPSHEGRKNPEYMAKYNELLAHQERVGAAIKKAKGE